MADKNPDLTVSRVKKFYDTEVEKVAGALRQMWFTISTEDRDRHGDVVVASGWKLQHYKKNPVMLWAHDYTKPPIGKAVDIFVENAKLRAKVEFVPGDIDPFAEQVRRLYEEKFMRTTSVGFMTYDRKPLTDEDKKQRPNMSYGERLYGELLEFSGVPVPANPMALQNGFMEAMARGMERAPVEPFRPSALLRVESPELIRASMLALLGARGGLDLPQQEREKQLEGLRRIAQEAGDGDAVADFVAGASLDTLRDKYASIWDGALLDVLQHAQGAEPEPAIEVVGLKTEELEAVKAVLASSVNTLAAVNAALK